MTYNHKNERTVRGDQANGSAWKANAVQYVYDENSHLIGEYSADGVPLVEYVWMGDKPVAAIYGSGTTSKTYWIVTDAQNTPRRLIDAADGTTAVWAWDSTAFGVGLPSVQTVKFNLRFPGQYYDEVTKQHYNHNRFYNPVLGRYIEPDRIGLEGGLNPYVYVDGNPIDYTDETGLNRNSRYLPMVIPRSDPITTLRVHGLVRDIQRFIPNFRYQTFTPTGQPTYTARDIIILQNRFNQLSNYGQLPFLTPGGQYRANQYSQNWQQASLSNAIREHTGTNPRIYTSGSQKTIYENSKTGRQVVYDRSGNYFRINDPSINSRRSYLGLHGENVSNFQTPNGSQMGRSTADYNQATHFLALP